MYDATVVKVLNGQGSLVEEAECKVGGETSPGINVEEDGPVGGVLKEQVDVCALAKAVEVADAVGVGQGLVEGDFYVEVVTVRLGKAVLVDLVSLPLSGRTT